jgi:hypothetical protein
VITNPAEVLTYSLMKIATQPVQQQDICNNYPVNINILAILQINKYLISDQYLYFCLKFLKIQTYFH